MPMNEDRYRRQTTFAKIGEKGQHAISTASVAIVGVGALGTNIAERLTRAGVGYLRLIDRDWVELDNLPRQALFDQRDAHDRRPKAIAATEKLSSINSTITIEPHVIDFQNDNALELINDCDILIDGTDNFETRYLMNDVSLEKNIPWIHGGIIGASGQVMGIVPHQTCCLRCILPDIPDAEAMETCNSAGVVGPSVTLVASLQSILALKMIVEGTESIASQWIAIDSWDLSFRNFKASRQTLSVHCPACQGARDFLEGKLSRTTDVLCGRNAVQISNPHRKQVDLQALAAKNAGLPHDINPFFLRLNIAPHEITVFKDGRTIVSGTEDATEARRLIAQWIGG
jgi:adenylyltransferase/sulfurtransferase